MSFRLTILFLIVISFAIISTLFQVSVHAAGEVDEGVPQIVESVWNHFIFEQLEPYIKSGKHLIKE
ncbi:MAG: hypothetical protein P8X47_05340 [Ignavibacteriaceae bacterium]